MNKETLTPKINSTAKRLKIILKLLNDHGITQAEIANSANIDPAALSRLKSGKTKSIPANLVDTLQKRYYINPKYIYCTSDIMVDIMGKKLSALNDFVDSWDTVKKQGIINGENIIKDYLHFKMDKNLYDFLIEVNKAKLIVEEGFSSMYDEIENLKELYESDSKSQEYVVIPRNDFTNIVEEAARDIQYLNEIIDLTKHLIYLNESEITPTK